MLVVTRIVKRLFSERPTQAELEKSRDFLRDGWVKMANALKTTGKTDRATKSMTLQVWHNHLKRLLIWDDANYDYLKGFQEPNFDFLFKVHSGPHSLKAYMDDDSRKYPVVSVN